MEVSQELAEKAAYGEVLESDGELRGIDHITHWVTTGLYTNAQQQNFRGASSL